MGEVLSPIKDVELKERTKSEVTAEGVKLLPARFGWICWEEEEEKEIVEEEEEEEEEENGKERRGRILMFQEVNRERVWFGAKVN